MLQRHKILHSMLTVFAMIFILFSIFPKPALAFDLNAAALNILQFIKILIVVGTAAITVVLILRSQIVPAVIVVIAAALFYVILEPETMKVIGNAILTLLGAGSGNTPTPGS